jgi:copper chaperone CopZ
MNDLNTAPMLKTEAKLRHFIVENATCGHCKGRIERWASAQPGVAAADFDLAGKLLTITCATNQEPDDAGIIEGLAKEGYPTMVAG